MSLGGVAVAVRRLRVGYLVRVRTAEYKAEPVVAPEIDRGRAVAVAAVENRLTVGSAVRRVLRIAVAGRAAAARSGLPGLEADKVATAALHHKEAAMAIVEA